MAMIQWKEKYSVGVEEFDNQHKKLIEMINELHDAMKAGKGKTVVSKIVEDLVEYTDTHFKAEEKYFDQYAYPDAAAHKAEHIDFVKKVVDFKDELNAGKITLSIDVMNFLSDWLRGHISGTDKQYTIFFNEKGLN